MAKLAPEVLAHLEWIGFLQPTGLVVSAPALVRAGAILNRNDQEGQRRLRAVVEERVFDPGLGPEPHLHDFRSFATEVLGWRWSPKGFASKTDDSIPDELRLHLPDYGETLEPDHAVRERDAEEGRSPWQLLVRELALDQDLDKPTKSTGHLEASPHARLERLLRGTGAPAGLLFNGRVLRLVSAPRGESAGWMDFRVADMVQTAGRPICAALRLLLSEERLLALPREQRLPALLESSRKFQNEVSERLAQQVLHALYELVRGFQSAHDASKGELLRDPLAEHPDEVYRALLTVLLRLVFLLYAEERSMLPSEEAFIRHYSLAGLHERLRRDAALHPDTMDQRFGAWGQLLVLFRMIYDGAEADALRLPSRHGVLFDPNRFPFLEGRSSLGVRQGHERIEVPLVPDGTIYRALSKLLVLDGERISYRALDVEQIGSVYETMMGFRIETATGASVAIKAQKKGGAPTTIDLESLLATPSGKREKRVLEKAERKLPKTATSSLKAATSIEELHAALEKVVDKAATPDLVAKGSLVLQPSEARRKSGSHYTPRELTEPIVRTTLRPILDRLREKAGGPTTPEQILDLKVCDPAMGSGAFLVEACRQLGDALIEAWGAHDARPQIPGDEDEVIHARRLVAQRCLYGVDRNPVAVDLAKVSLWLATLARDHAFTFVDHALRHGDSLVGLANAQIAARDWSKEEPLDSPKYRQLKAEVDEVVALRRQIREAGDETSDWELRDLLDEAEHKASEVRTWGDLVIEAFFSADKDKARKEALGEAAKQIAGGVDSSERARLDEVRRQDPPLAPFHWELEFPEVFERELPGMDAFVGNPPFAGKNTLTSANVSGYIAFLVQAFEESNGKSDLIAFFFRRAASLLRPWGALGLIATNTIGQGDTRHAGLRYIATHGGTIYDATRRLKWPGSAAVMVSVVHISPEAVNPRILDGREVDCISAFLAPGNVHEDPERLNENADLSFQGSNIDGQGFLFADGDPKANTLEDLRRVTASNPRVSEVIQPYLGGENLNQSPRLTPARLVIRFGQRDLKECEEQWPELVDLVRGRVKPFREKRADNSQSRRLKEIWWKWHTERPTLYTAIRGLDRVIVNSQVSSSLAFAMQRTDITFGVTLNVFALQGFAAFAALQSRPHEVWARFFGSSMKDDLRYTPSDCFETFPFPKDWQAHPALEAAGQAYYDFRAELMIETDLGLTKTYNRFHNPDEDDPKIVRLRELHAAMDRAVLDAYGWTDIPTDCEFLLDYEDEDDDGESRRKKPWRYRWPDEVRDEVLARLLELNAERAKEDRRAGRAAKMGANAGTGDLFL